MLHPLLATLRCERDDDERDIIRGTIATALGIIALQLDTNDRQLIVDAFDRLIEETVAGNYLVLQIVRTLRIIIPKPLVQHSQPIWRSMDKNWEPSYLSLSSASGNY